MKVKELIEYLNTLDGELDVITEIDYEPGDYTILGVNDLNIESHIYNNGEYLFDHNKNKYPNATPKDCLRIF